jgi:hypothetical protein
VEKTTYDEVEGMYCSPNIIQVIKSRRWARHVARMGESCIQGFLGETGGKQTNWKT